MKAPPCIICGTHTVHKICVRCKDHPRIIELYAQLSALREHFQTLIYINQRDDISYLNKWLAKAREILGGE